MADDTFSSDQTACRASADEATRHRSPGETPDPTPALEAPTRRRNPPVDGERLELEPGTIIRRRYLLERLIGSGGMGQVWRAKDLVSEKALDPNPFVALKFLNADIESDPDAFVALQRESRKAQELAHPNIITVYAFDIDESAGRAFMSMELLEGQSVDAVIRANGRGLPKKEAVSLIIGMAKGLEYAHKKSIVHSDFKPGNVFSTASGPKILDFGIARAAKVGGSIRPADTFDAGVFGGLTIAYASPGMIENAEPEPADDVYALGLVAYELLSGRPPFNWRSAIDARDAKLIPARIGGLRRYEWRALARALEFDPRERWQNAGEFLRAFEGKSVAVFAMAVLATTLALTAGGFWYEARIEAGPAVPLEALSSADQQLYHQHMADGDGEWRLVMQGFADQTMEALQAYAKAYDLHPRDRDSSAALKKTADFIIQKLDRVDDRTLRLKQLQEVQGTSNFFSNYSPLNDAIKKASSQP